MLAVAGVALYANNLVADHGDNGVVGQDTTTGAFGINDIADGAFSGGHGNSPAWDRISGFLGGRVFIALRYSSVKIDGRGRPCHGLARSGFFEADRDILENH